MQDILESLRAALTPDASPELRAAGAQACRTLLTALEPASTPVMPSPPPSPAAPAIADLVSSLRGVPAEQLLDLAIAKLRNALPPDAQLPSASPLKFQFVPISRRG